MVFCSYTLAGLLELADISLPEDFGDEEREVAISGLQNRSHKVHIETCCMHSLTQQAHCQYGQYKMLCNSKQLWCTCAFAASVLASP